jgi:hypothetical protein
MHLDDLSDFQLIQISGLIGLFSEKEIQKIKEGKRKNLFRGFNRIDFKNDYLDCCLFIDRANYTIHIQRFVSRQPGNYLFMRVLAQMIKYASKYGFKEVKCIGSCGVVNKQKMSGYVVLALCGFLMNITDHERFLREFGHYPLKKNNINNYIDTRIGRDRWTKDGFKWAGTFFLTRESECVAYFVKALKKRGLQNFLL